MRHFNKLFLIRSSTALICNCSVADLYNVLSYVSCLGFTRCAAVTESRPEPEPDTHSAAVTSSRPEPEPDTRCTAVTESRPEVKIIKKPKQKKIIYKEISDDEDEEEIVYIKKPKPKQETYDRTLYKSATEQLHMRAVEERIRNNLLKWRHALEPVEY